MNDYISPYCDESGEPVLPLIVAQVQKARHAMTDRYDEIAAALHGIRNRLDRLASINTGNILIPGGPQERYHQFVEEACAVLRLIETEIDGLRTELEYQDSRLDEICDAALADDIWAVSVRTEAGDW